jgi:hypothetical protein
LGEARHEQDHLFILNKKVYIMVKLQPKRSYGELFNFCPHRPDGDPGQPGFRRNILSRLTSSYLSWHLLVGPVKWLEKLLAPRGGRG